MPMHNIAGEWRGHYQYRRHPDSGCAFSAFFSENAGTLTGTIVDDSFPGKASLTGSFSFPAIQFTKFYAKQGSQIENIKKQGNTTVYTIAKFGNPVEYTGSMTEDGKSMSGTWSITSESGVSTTGTWVAHKFEEEAKEKTKEKASRVKEPQLEEHLL